MQPSIDKKYIEINDNKETMPNEERVYFTKKLQEAEEYNLEHPEVMTSEEFYNKIKEKYCLNLIDY